jgi:hypothetical protein
MTIRSTDRDATAEVAPVPVQTGKTGRLLRVPIVCAVCGQTAPPKAKGPRATYCSATCRRAAAGHRQDVAVDARLRQLRDALVAKIDEMLLPLGDFS